MIRRELFHIFAWRRKDVLMKMTNERILSIDAFRGITIFTMIFVNELAGVSGMPAWMKHMAADDDGMTFVDVVFPAFLFIVGMSIPFAIQNRILKGDTLPSLQKHILMRALGLLVLGVFMVNAEDGYHKASMPISIHTWSLLFYGAVILIWNDYKIHQQSIVNTLRITGVAQLIILAFLFRGGPAGEEHLTPHWWGILGLIGWAYLLGCLFFQLSKANTVALIAIIGVCIAYYCIGHSSLIAPTSSLKILFSQGGHAAHTSIVLCGIVLSLLFFDETKIRTVRWRFTEAFAFAVLLFIAGFFLRPYFKISKIYATPTWCLYSSVICIAIFALLYWTIDIRKNIRWTTFFSPAAANALLTYLIPFIVYEALSALHISLPSFLYAGIAGLIWAVFYAVLVMGFAAVLNKLRVRLQL